ncbi:MAG: glycosyl hydrolase [Chitinophagales bacterium]|nr:MAG: glycosyl hydrolase [Chitinophagales bacterium]
MKILLIRFSSIGDIVLTTPVIRCLKQQVKDAEVHYLTKPAYREILIGNPFLDAIHTLSGSAISTALNLRKEHYHWIIDLHNNPRSWLVKSIINVQNRSFHKQNIDKWLLVHLHFRRSPIRHVVHRYLDTVRFLHVVDDGKGLDYFIPPEEEVVVSALSPLLGSGYIAWVIAAAHNTKKFPAEKIIRACKMMHKPVVLIGGKTEFEEGEMIRRAIGERVINACGKFSINQSASLIRQATAVVSNDTGMMHIAAAFSKPLVSLWGNTVPAFGMYPYYGSHSGPHALLETEGLPCRPCSKLGFNRCPRKHFFCMQQIDEQQIVALLNCFDR